MLSVAGGIYPGQLQAFYELLGPNTHGSWVAASLYIKTGQRQVQQCAFALRARPSKKE